MVWCGAVQCGVVWCGVVATEHYSERKMMFHCWSATGNSIEARWSGVITALHRKKREKRHL